MESILSVFTPKKLTSYLNENITVRQAIEIFDVHKYSVVPLVDDLGHYVGTISEGDLLRYLKNELNFDYRAAEKVSINKIEKYRPYRELKADSLLPEFFSLSLEQNFVPVIDDNGIYIGIIKRREIIKYLSNKIKLSFDEDE